MSDNPPSVAAVRMLLLGQKPESYAKGCTALGGAYVVIWTYTLNADDQNTSLRGLIYSQPTDLCTIYRNMSQSSVTAGQKVHVNGACS